MLNKMVKPAAKPFYNSLIKGDEIASGSGNEVGAFLEKGIIGVIVNRGSKGEEGAGG